MTEKQVHSKASFLEKLKGKWGLSSLFQVVMILLVFSLTGMTVVLIRPVIFSWFGFDDQTNFITKSITYILLIFPMYQILILIFGALLGQFSFFWEKEKKLFSAIIRPFQPKAKDNLK